MSGGHRTKQGQGTATQPSHGAWLPRPSSPRRFGSSVPSFAARSDKRCRRIFSSLCASSASLRTTSRSRQKPATSKVKAATCEVRPRPKKSRIASCNASRRIASEPLLGHKLSPVSPAPPPIIDDQACIATDEQAAMRRAKKTRRPSDHRDRNYMAQNLCAPFSDSDGESNRDRSSSFASFAFSASSGSSALAFSSASSASCASCAS